MTKTNVQPIPSNSQHHDTPNNKTHVIKFRVTENEKLELECTAKLLNLLVLVSCLAMRKTSILLCIAKTKLYLESWYLLRNVALGYRYEGCKKRMATSQSGQHRMHFTSYQTAGP